MEPLSLDQARWRFGEPLPEPEQVGNGVWALAMAMPDGHIHYSFTYLVIDARGELHVLDPGWLTDDNWERLLRGIAVAGGTLERVMSVTSSHLHADHLGLARRLRSELGVPIGMHRIEQTAMQTMNRNLTDPDFIPSRLTEWGVPADRLDEINRDEQDRQTRGPLDFTADVLLDDGDELDFPGRTMLTLRTPGHTPGSMCFVATDDHLLFTGDHILPTIYPGLGLGGPTPTNALADYLGSLAAVRRYEAFDVLPGHGYRFTGLGERCDVIALHHLRRSREVREMSRANPGASVWDIASRIRWTAGWDNLKGFYVVSALRQTAMHLDFAMSEAGDRALAATLSEGN